MRKGSSKTEKLNIRTAESEIKIIRYERVEGIEAILFFERK